MESLFKECLSLKTIPDISKWNVNKVENIGYMFSQCTSLICLPEISKWKLNNLKIIEGLFSYCSSLIILVYQAYFVNVNL